jgi:REP element-mobilizing transposase RayT
MLPLQPDTSYHIYNHANGFENIFAHDANYWYFLQKYQLYIHPIAECYAWCLMPNHFHLVIRVRKKEVIESLIKGNTHPKVSNFGKGIPPLAALPITQQHIEKYLSKQFANLFSCYTQSYNKVYNRMGSLFIKNFKRELISDKTQFLNTIAYVHRNPIHHGFCEAYEEWTYSSFSQIKSGIKYEIEIEADKLLKITNGMEGFVNLHQQSLLKLKIDDIPDIPML